MLDSFGRKIDYLRVSVTDRCNLRCVYCMPVEGVVWKSHAQILSFEELAAVCRIFARLGITKIKVSGGEPLVRRGLCAFIAALKTTAGIEQVTLTTNGLVLDEHLDALLKAGLDAVNISLDTLSPVLFGKITRYPYSTEGGTVKNKGLERILTAIDRSLAAGLRVKINCVPIEGLNGEDILPLAALARDKPLSVRFIELMPLGRAAAFSGIPAQKVLEMTAAAFGTPQPVGEKLGNGPAVYYKPQAWRGQIGIIAAISGGFCETCNRLRLSSEGFLSPCLSSTSKTDVRALLRSGAPESAIEKCLAAVIQNKPRAHSFSPLYMEPTTHPDTAMWKIGG
ncbi:MAG: GTP 3',8-cyclase MoaA [Spirochaetaceae bacterium]|jgi:cyclic pyranopterin phosphate synthase|nr:GTP 3',8-cyclase MoaA [Spirochaetaceae bacterium]